MNRAANPTSDHQPVMQHFFQSSTRLSLLVCLLGAITLSGCGAPPATPEATTAVNKIEQIQSNSALSPSVKATAIAQEQAKQGSSSAR